MGTKHINHEKEQEIFRNRINENLKIWEHFTIEEKIKEMENLKILTNNKLILDIKNGIINNIGGK